MHKQNKLLSVVLLFSSFGLVAFSASANETEELHNKNCQQCHDNSIYTRSKSIIQSYPELQARVDFCESAARAHWSDEQTQSVVDYLNQKFYTFERP